MHCIALHYYDAEIVFSKKGDVGVLLQALGLAELLDGRYLHGVVLLEESVRYPPQFLDNADKESIMADRFRRARVLRWKTVQAARMRAVHR